MANRAATPTRPMTRARSRTRSSEPRNGLARSLARVDTTPEGRFVFVFHERARFPQSLVDRREFHGIGMVDAIRNVDEVDEIGEWHRLAVDARSTEEPHHSVARRERRREIGETLRARE